VSLFRSSRLGIRRLAEPPHVDPKDFAEEEHLSSEEHFIDIQLVKGNKGRLTVRDGFYSGLF